MHRGTHLQTQNKVYHFSKLPSHERGGGVETPFFDPKTDSLIHYLAKKYCFLLKKLQYL